MVLGGQDVFGAPGGPMMPLTGLQSVRRVFNRPVPALFDAMLLGDTLSIG